MPLHHAAIRIVTRDADPAGGLVEDGLLCSRMAVLVAEDRLAEAAHGRHRRAGHHRAPLPLLVDEGPLRALALGRGVARVRACQSSVMCPLSKSAFVTLARLMQQQLCVKAVQFWKPRNSLLRTYSSR